MATWITFAITKVLIIIALIAITIYLCRYRNTTRTVRTDLNDLLMRLELLRGVRNPTQVEKEKENGFVDLHFVAETVAGQINLISAFANP